MNSGLISVIIPTYNRAQTIGETVDSVLAQTYRNIEVIVIDDGSQDDTQEVLRRYGGRIRNIHQDNAGQMAARNRGIREARGDVIAFLDSDDLWLPQCIERHARALERSPEGTPCSLVNGWLHFADGRRLTSFENSHLFPSLTEGLCVNIPDILASRFVMFCQFVAIRRTALLTAKGFDEDLDFMEDYALPLRLSLLGPWAFVSEPLVTWRQGTTDSISVSQRAIRQEEALRQSLLRIRSRYLSMIGNKPECSRTRKLQLRELHFDGVELRAIRLRKQGRSLAGNLLFKMVQYRKALFRRGPWFPRMRVQAFRPDAAGRGKPAMDLSVERKTGHA